MIIDAGFTIKSDKSAEDLLQYEGKESTEHKSESPWLKSDIELHPARQKDLS